MVDNNVTGNRGGTSQATDEATVHSSSRIEQARHAVTDAAHRARERAREAAHVAAERATHTIDSRKDLVASRLSRIATSIRDASQCFADNDEVGLGSYVEMAADRLEEAGDYLQEHNFDDLRHETAVFLRRHPEIGLAGAFIGGLLIARFLRASASHDTKYSDGGIHEEPSLYGGYEGSSAGHWGSGHTGYGPGRGVITPTGRAVSSGPTAPGHAMAHGEGRPAGEGPGGYASASAPTTRASRFNTGDESCDL